MADMTDAERRELLAEAERLEAEAEAIRRGEIDPDDDSDEPDQVSNSIPMESPGDGANAAYPPAPPPSDKRTKDLENNAGRRCTAHRKNGEQCRKWAIYGGTVCATHGGRAAHVRDKARRRIESASDRMAERLLGLAENNLPDGQKVSPYVQVQAVNSALDRAGIAPPQKLDVTVKPYQELLENLTTVTGGSLADFRRANGDPRPVPERPAPPETPQLANPALVVPGVLDAEVIDGYDDVDAEVVRHAGGFSQPGRAEDTGDGSKTLGGPMANGPLALPAGQGLIDAETAMAEARAANAAHLHEMRRR